MDDIHDVLSRGELDLVTGQSLLGKLNFVSTMCPMMRTFKKPLQNLLACLLELQNDHVPLPDEVKSDLLTWWIFLKSSDTGLPIIREVSSPPLCHKVLTTDAAGWKKEDSSQTRVGMGCVGIDEEGEISSQVNSSGSQTAQKLSLIQKQNFLDVKQQLWNLQGF